MMKPINILIGYSVVVSKSPKHSLFYQDGVISGTNGGVSGF